MGCLCPAPPLKAQKSMWKRRSSVRNRGEWPQGSSIFCTQQGWCMGEFTDWQHVWELHQLKPDKISAMRRGSRYRAPSQEAVCNCYLLGEGKPVLSFGMSLGILTTPRGRPHAQSLANTNQVPFLFVCALLTFFGNGFMGGAGGCFCLFPYFLFVCFASVFWLDKTKY